MNVRCCFNWRFLLVAAVMAGGTWLITPQAALPVAVLLIALSCPASMLLAMRRRGHGCRAPKADDAENPAPETEDRIRSLRAEIEDLRRRRENT